MKFILRFRGNVQQQAVGDTIDVGDAITGNYAVIGTATEVFIYEIVP